LDTGQQRVGIGGGARIVVGRYTVGERQHSRVVTDRADPGRLQRDAACRRGGGVLRHIDVVSRHAIEVLIPGRNRDHRRIGPVEDQRGQKRTVIDDVAHTVGCPGVAPRTLARQRIVAAKHRRARAEPRRARAELIAVSVKDNPIDVVEIIGREVDCARIALEVAVGRDVRPIGSDQRGPQLAPRGRLQRSAGVLHRGHKALVQAVVGDAIGLLGLQGARVESGPNAVVALRIAAHIDAAIAGHPQIAGGVDDESTRIRMRGGAVAGVRERDAGGGLPLNSEGRHGEGGAVYSALGDVNDGRVGRIDGNRQVDNTLFDPGIEDWDCERGPRCAAVLRQIKRLQLCIAGIRPIRDGNRDRAVGSSCELRHQLVVARGSGADVIGAAADRCCAGEYRRPTVPRIPADIDARRLRVTRRSDRREERAGPLCGAVARILWIGHQRRHRTGGKSLAGLDEVEALPTIVAEIESIESTITRGGLRGCLNLEGRRENSASRRRNPDHALAGEIGTTAPRRPGIAAVGGMEQPRTRAASSRRAIDVEVVPCAVRGDTDAGDQSLSGRIGRVQREAGDRGRGLPVGQRLPCRPAVGRPPDAAVDAADEHRLRAECGIEQDRLHRAGNGAVRRRIAALHHIDRPELRRGSLRNKGLIDLNLRSGDRRQRQRCRDDEPTQSCEHETPPTEHELTSPRL
jgi:hypothetical protein